MISIIQLLKELMKYIGEIYFLNNKASLRHYIKIIYKYIHQS